jgi:AcrR family transcriptional regulator
MVVSAADARDTAAYGVAVPRIRLTAADWESAALAAIAEEGLAAAAVEPLARRLGVTKGSFYWHFANRDALLGAAIERWERLQLADIEGGVRLEDPHEELRELARKALKLVGRPSIQRRLTAEADADPRIAAALARVTRARVARIEQIYRRLGLTPAHARARAAVAYAAVLGLEQIDREGELRVSERTLAAELLATLTP